VYMPMQKIMVSKVGGARAPLRERNLLYEKELLNIQSTVAIEVTYEYTSE